MTTWGITFPRPVPTRMTLLCACKSCLAVCCAEWKWIGANAYIINIFFIDDVGWESLHDWRNPIVSYLWNWIDPGVRMNCGLDDMVKMATELLGKSLIKFKEMRRKYLKKINKNQRQQILWNYQAPPLYINILFYFIPISMAMVW